MSNYVLSTNLEGISQQLAHLPEAIHAAEVRMVQASRDEHEAALEATKLQALRYRELAATGQSHYPAYYGATASQDVSDARRARVARQELLAVAKAEYDRLRRHYEAALALAGLLGIGANGAQEGTGTLAAASKPSMGLRESLNPKPMLPRCEEALDPASDC